MVVGAEVIRGKRDGESPAVDGDPRIRKANAAMFAAGYTKKKRFLECCYLSFATYLWFTQFIMVARYFVHNSEVHIQQLVWTPVMIIFAMALSDFVGGLVHWGLDTWGTKDTIFFGNFIRSFREHHVDQTAMTKHDFIETNADTTLPLIPILLFQRYCFFSTTRHDSAAKTYNIHNNNVGWHVFLLTLTLFVALTNQVHKWSHMAKPPPLVRFLMSCHLLLPPRLHRLHHRGNHDMSYCITTGWMNGILDRVNFWRKLEAVITALTGEIPRANDQKMLGK